MNKFSEADRIEQFEKLMNPYVSKEFRNWLIANGFFTAPASIHHHGEYNNATLLPGHGEKSVIMLQQHMSLTDEEMLCIRWHMGAFDDKEHWNSYGRSVTHFPNVLYTHTADMVAARILGV